MSETIIHHFVDTINEIDGIGFFEFFTETNTIFLSSKSRQMLGIVGDAPIIMKEVFSLVDEPYRTAIMETIAEAASAAQSHTHYLQYQEKIYKNDCLITTAQGKKRWIRIYRKHALEAGYIVIRGYLQEITAEIQQRTIMREFQDLYDNAPYGYHTATLDGAITNMNTTMRRYLGYEPHEIRLGEMHLRHILAPNSYTFRFDVLPKLFEENILRDMEIEYVRKDGSHFFGLVSAILLRDNEGNPIATRVATMDLTERKRLQYAEMKAEAAEEANRLRTEFLNLISHEFRTPLGVVMGVADALHAHIDEEGKQYLAMLETNGNRLLQMLNNVLELAKTESNANEPPLFQYLNVKHFFSTLHKQWDAQLQTHAIEYLPEVSPNLPDAVLTDVLRLERILHSLFDNAVKFTEHGFVRLSVHYTSSSDAPNAATLHIRLKDTGSGIPPEHLNNIFEPFYQAHRGTTREYDGTGIGLTVVRSLVKQMRGTIQISSVVGSGTTAVLTVPILLVSENPDNT